MSETRSNSPDVSIIIVNWNARWPLRDCLQSIVAETRAVSYETIVVDNASSDESAELVASRFPDVRLIANRTNRGFAAANNQGIAAAAGRFLLLLNPDTVILNGAIDKAVAFADARPAAGVIGCKVFCGDGSLQHTAHMYPRISNVLLGLTGLPRLFPGSALFGRAWMQGWDHGDVRDVEWLAGCFFLVRREAIEDVGGMDEEFFMYGEDIDWCRRFHDAGWKVLYCPDARIKHLLGHSAASPDRNLTLERRKSLIRWFTKHRSPISTLAAHALYAASDAANLVLALPVALVSSWRGSAGGVRRVSLRSRLRTFAFHAWSLVTLRPFGGWLRAARRAAVVCGSVAWYGLAVLPRTGLRALIGGSARETLVLYYHGVPNERRAAFARQMDMLVAAGTPVSLGKGGATSGSHARAIAVTFDDAFASVASNALPALAARAIPCTIFVPSGRMGDAPRWRGADGAAAGETVMARSDIAALDKELVTVGSHGVSHAALGNLTGYGASLELADSRSALEEVIGRQVDLVAFPYGSFEAQTLEAARAAGYAHAFSIEPRLAAPGEFVSGRFKASPDDSRLEFWLKLRGAFGWLYHAQRARRGARRLMRRLTTFSTSASRASEGGSR